MNESSTTVNVPLFSTVPPNTAKLPERVEFLSKSVAPYSLKIAPPPGGDVGRERVVCRRQIALIVDRGALPRLAVSQSQPVHGRRHTGGNREIPLPPPPSIVRTPAPGPSMSTFLVMLIGPSG